MGAASTDQAIAQVQRAILGVFSWILLMAVGVIISGKLLALRIPLRLKSDDLFSINLLLFKLRASGDEVSLGLATFILTLGPVVVLGGSAAYGFFREHTGLEIGQWNSLCAISSFFSIVVATAVWILASLIRGQPLISAEERAEQIKKLGG